MTATDIITIPAVILAVALLLILGLYLNDTITDSFKANSEINKSIVTTTAMTNYKNTLDSRLDYFLPAVLFGSMLGLVILSYIIGADSIFLLIYMIVGVISIIFSSAFAYFWDVIKGISAFAGQVGFLPITNHILAYFPIYITIILFMGIIAMFLKPAIYGETL